MFLVGDRPTGFIPLVEAALHKILIGKALAEGTAFNRQLMAKTMDDEHRLGVDEIGDLGHRRFRIVSLRYHHRVTVAYPELCRGLGVDPQGVDRHLLKKQWVVDRMSLGMEGAAAKGQAEAPFRRGIRGLEGLQ